ncbi:hypothetical protein [Streptomyces sp. KM273126]|uniref:hypothetical protein n=1 Tax=Streptomyces sp. KM273126 TaxID=2545247 RepID=UPI00215D75F1|nr:hypothetical protein [Streptomyces sp. KM273126]
MDFTVDSRSPGARVADGEVHGGERAIVDAQGVTVMVEDVEDVLGAAHEAEHLRDVRGVARPRVSEQFAELRALERVEVRAFSSKTTGSSVPASVRTRFCRGDRPLVG